MQTASSGGERELRFQEVVAAYLERLEGGEAEDLAALLRSHPDLAGEIAAFFENQERFARLIPPAVVVDRPGGGRPDDGLGRVQQSGPRKRRLGEAIVAWLQAREAGQPLDRQELLAEYPELAEDLAAFFEGQQHLEELASPLRSVVTSPTPLPTGETTLDEGRDYPAVPGYEILGICGHGGMGVVYRARQLKANRLVALKMIRAVEHARPTERLRFQIETEAVARLQHPHIVQLYEASEVRGQPFFSLELCDGGSLAEQLKKQRPSARESATLIETLARAMHYAHLRGVVHRDLKPSNVLLTGAERVAKISDFGLAKRIDAEGRDVSQSGAIMGTAAYMAPEQAAGKVRDTGPAADVYALGALLYECLTGRAPFDGPQHVVLVSVLHDEPVPPSRRGAKVPADLETICLKCLSKEPARRYASAEELANDLRRYQVGEPIRARPVGAVERAAKWVRRNKVVASLLTAVVLVLVGGIAVSSYFAWDASNKEQVARQEADKARKARDFLVSIFAIKDVQSGNTTTARQILNQTEQRIPIEFAEQPQLRDELLAAIKDVNRNLDRAIPAAMILEARGTAQLHSRREGARPVPQALLYPDDRLTLAADARVQLVFLSDLHKERLHSGREATIGRTGCAPADVVRERDDSVLMTFVRLRKGRFYMGWDGKPGSATKTEIKEDFEIAVHDVTQGQWEAIMGAGNNPSWFSRKGEGRGNVLDISNEELKLFPVENVSWDDAQAFIKKLNEKERGSGYLYRLPTEAEWEYSCRGGATSLEECSYHFYLDKPTNDLSSEQANFQSNYPFDKAPKGPYLQRTTRVGAYPSNRLGLCDMHGNVWQWTDTAKGSDRVYRGGSYRSPGSDCQAASRDRVTPAGHSGYLGFRLARVPVSIALLDLLDLLDSPPEEMEAALGHCVATVERKLKQLKRKVDWPAAKREGP